MSPSRRDSRFANSGMVVSVEMQDIKAYHKYEELATMEFQAAIEQKAWHLGGETQVAPAQRMVDFVKKNVSGSLADTSYQPGLLATDMREVTPIIYFRKIESGF